MPPGVCGDGGWVVHDGSGRLVVANLSKQFGPVNAVQDLSFSVEPGSVTGFVGPNGSGKTTTLRALLGLVVPTSGHTTINGVPFGRLGNPARVVGAVLETQGFHPGRSARNHLLSYCAAIGVAEIRAEQLLDLVGLTTAAHRGAGSFSMGMRQRLALATALLGDPQVLILDEPANGLDPEGIAWLRGFMRSFASGGRTVLVSSHLLAEMEQTVDQLVIISRGQCVYQGQLDELRGRQRRRVLVQCADRATLAAALAGNGIVEVDALPDGRLAVTGATAAQIGEIALGAGVAVHGMVEETADLEQLFFQLTAGQYAPMAAAGGYPVAAPAGLGPPAGYGMSAGYGPPPAYGPPGYGPPPAYGPPGYGPPPGYGYQQPPAYPRAPEPPAGYQPPPAYPSPAEPPAAEPPAAEPPAAEPADPAKDGQR